jgi:hypothetical protein
MPGQMLGGTLLAAVSRVLAIQPVEFRLSILLLGFRPLVLNTLHDPTLSLQSLKDELHQSRKVLHGAAYQFRMQK